MGGSMRRRERNGGCCGRRAWGRRRQKKLARRQRKVLRRQRKGLRSQNGGIAVTHTDPLLARPVGNRSERDKTSQENRSRVVVIKTMVTELVNGVIDSGRFVGPSSEAGETAAVGNSVCKRRCRSYHGVGGELSPHGGWKIRWKVPFRRQPPRYAPNTMRSG